MNLFYEKFASESEYKDHVLHCMASIIKPRYTLRIGSDYVKISKYALELAVALKLGDVNKSTITLIYDGKIVEASWELFATHAAAC